MFARTFALPALFGLALLAGCSDDPPRRAAVRVVYVAPPPRCEWIGGHWRRADDGDRVWIPGRCDRD